MKRNQAPHSASIMVKSGLALLALVPVSAQAREGLLAVLPVEMSITTFAFIGALLVLSVIMFFIFQHRFKAATRELRRCCGWRAPLANADK